MKKVLKENELRSVISNKVRMVLKEMIEDNGVDMERMAQSDSSWESYGDDLPEEEDYNSELKAAEEWFEGLSSEEKVEIFRQYQDDNLEAPAEGADVTEYEATMGHTSVNESQFKNIIRKMVKESMEDMGMAPEMDTMDNAGEGVEPEALCDNIMEQAKSELGEDAEKYRKSCLSLCTKFLAKHPELNDIDDAYDELMEDPTPERSRYMKLFHFNEWKQAATVEDLVAYQKSKGRWDDARCQEWAEAEYAKMHGGEDAEGNDPAGMPAGLAEAIAKNITKALRNL